jgi:hypothetical protein
MIAELGTVNVAGLLGLLAFTQYAVISLWYVYTAVLSVLLYSHCHRRCRANCLGGPLKH